MLDVYVEPSGRRIQPFDDPIGETLILNQSLASWLDDAIREAGLTRIKELRAPCLVVPDNLFATGSALRQFAELAAGRNAVFVLAKSMVADQLCAVQPGMIETEDGWRLPALRWVSGDDAPPIDIAIDPQERLIELPIPRGYRDSDAPAELGIPKHVAVPVTHWVHVLWLNQLAFGITLRHTPRWQLALRGLWAAMRAVSLNKWKVLGKVNQIGRGCDIHPTAVVEASTLGANVKVGAFARVLFSHVADGAEIMPQSSVEASVIGERAVVAQQTVLRLCVLYPEAIAAQYLMQQCILGRRAVTTGGAFTLDVNFESDIRVELDGALWSSGSRFLGAAFGHRCRIGTGFYLASGRAVPNDYNVIRDPGQVLSKLPVGHAPETPLVADGNVLVPLTRGPRARKAG